MHARVYQSLPDIEIAALVDPQPAAKETAAKLGLACPIFPDLAEMLQGAEVAIVDICLPTEMHPGNLDTKGAFDFDGGIDVLCTAHHKIDPKTGDMLFFAAVGPNLTWYQADARTGKVVDTFTFSMGCPAMVHDYIVSEHHAIFLISPTQFRIDRIMAGRPGVL